MTVKISAEWTSYIEEQIRSGRFADADAVVRDALDRQRLSLNQRHPHRSDSDPLLGAMSDEADLLDAVVAEAMANRWQR